MKPISDSTLPIITITLNPALDQHSQIETLHINRVNRVQRTTESAAGKGINVATILALLGQEVTAMGWLGDANKSMFEKAFKQFSINDACMRVAGQTRRNIKLVEGNQQVTELNFPGFKINDENCNALIKQCNQLVSPSLIIIGGSLPSGVSNDFYALLITTLKKQGHIVFFDSSGDAFKQGVLSAPYLVKPNLEELSEWYGERLINLEDKKRAVDKLMALGIKQVLLSEGEQGVIWFNENEILQVNTPKVLLKSTVGAGDTLLAAFVYGLKHFTTDAHKQLRFAVASAAHSVTEQGVAHIDLKQIELLVQQCHSTVLFDK